VPLHPDAAGANASSPWRVWPLHWRVLLMTWPGRRLTLCGVGRKHGNERDDAGDVDESGHGDGGNVRGTSLCGLGRKLGHMAVKLASAFGARVVVFTTSPERAKDAVRLGAHEVVVSRNAAEMQKEQGSFDFILDTVSAVNEAYDRLAKGDVKHRFVVDIASLRS